MSCNNCFNGCTEIVSDQCVRYTGIAIPELGINNGDTLAAVELAITTYLIDALDGSGINPIVDPEIICNVISKYFAECAGCDGLSLNELLTAMIKAICDLQVQINATNATIAALEDAYLEPSAIDYVNVHGTSTPLGDVAEVKAIQHVFGEHAYNLNISSTKSMTGHLLGAAGAIEAIACIMAVKHDIVPPTINHFTDDPELDTKLNFTFNTAQKRVVNIALSNTFGFGGHNTSIIVKKFNG